MFTVEVYSYDGGFWETYGSYASPEAAEDVMWQLRSQGRKARCANYYADMVIYR